MARLPNNKCINPGLERDIGVCRSVFRKLVIEASRQFPVAGEASGPASPVIPASTALQAVDSPYRNRTTTQGPTRLSANPWS